LDGYRAQKLNTEKKTAPLEWAPHLQLPLTKVYPIRCNCKNETQNWQISKLHAREAAAKIAPFRPDNVFYPQRLEEAKTPSADLIISRKRCKRGYLADLRTGEGGSKVVAHVPSHVFIVARQAFIWHPCSLTEATTAQERQVVTSVIAIATERELSPHLVRPFPHRKGSRAGGLFIHRNGEPGRSKLRSCIAYGTKLKTFTKTQDSVAYGYAGLIFIDSGGDIRVGSYPHRFGGVKRDGAVEIPGAYRGFSMFGYVSNLVLYL
jgi:hypothetical protein